MGLWGTVVRRRGRRPPSDLVAGPTTGPFTGPVPTAAAPGMTEPTRSLPLHWGTYRGRYLAGLALIASSSAAIQGGNTYALFLIVLGTVAFFAGFTVLPARGARRLWMVFPAYLAVFFGLTGPQSTPAMVLVLVAWLVVRQRPALSFVTVIPLLVVTMGLATSFRDHADMPFSTAVTAVALVGCAWLARWLAQAGARRVRQVDDAKLTNRREQ